MIKKLCMPKPKTYAKILKLKTVLPSTRAQSSVPVHSNQREPIGWRINNVQYLNCSMCVFSTTSKHRFQQHIRRHKSICLNCRTKFASWEDYAQHVEFCSRRFGICVVPRGFSPPPMQNDELKYQCNFCKENLISTKRLSLHQKKQCRKRFASNKWVMKL